MAPSSLSAPPPLPLSEFIDRFDRQARDTMAATIARRMTADAVLQVGRNKRHTRTEIRPLAWPVWVGGRKCLVAVHIRYVLNRPREHTVETQWFESVVEARAAHPKAVLLPDVDRVQARLNA
jgi:hypothetical protein